MAVPDGATEIKTGAPILPQAGLVLIRFTLTNRGTQSIVRNYSLSVRPAGSSEEIKASAWAMPPVMNLNAGNVPRVWSGVDALYDKTFPTPLPTGGAVTGILFFGVPSVSPETLRQVGTMFLLRYDDVMDKTYTSAYTWTGKVDFKLRHYPGMKPETP